MVPDVVTSAEQLAPLREARGLSVGDLSQRLRLAPRQIDALERGAWEELPGLAFVRGSLRAYGRVLEVDVGPLVQSVGDVVSASDLRPSSSLEEPMPRRSMLGFGNGGSGSRWAWAALVLLVLIALAFFYGNDSLSPKDVPPTASAPATGEGPSASAAPVAATSGPEAMTPPAAEAVPVPANPPAVPASAPAAPASVVPTPAAALPVALLQFSGDSWVEIRRPDGPVLLSGNYRAGDTARLEQSGPLAITIGNASSVRLEYAGKPVDLNPHVRSNVARLTLSGGRP